MNDILNRMTATGLIRTPEPVVMFNDEPKYPNYLCYPSQAAAGRYRVAGVFGVGLDTDRPTAMIRAAAECLERICLFNPAAEDVPAKADESPPRIDPANFLLPGPNGASQSCVSEDQLDWRSAIDIRCGTKVLIPAQSIFLAGYRNDESRLRPEWTSSGAALGGASDGLAIERGLLEVVERDAIANFYYSGRRPRRIVDLPQEVESLTLYLRRYELETTLSDVSGDLPAVTVMATIVDRTGVGQAVCVGSKCAFDVTAACRGAILEAIQSRRAARYMRMVRGVSRATTPDIIDARMRYDYWSTMDRIEQLLDRLETSETVACCELVPGASKDQLLRRLEQIDAKVFLADATLPEVADCGWEVRKVVFPALSVLPVSELKKPIVRLRLGGDYTVDLPPHPWC
jgi:thiazole/oxazole-forming peptide maturase SagD family component